MNITDRTLNALQHTTGIFQQSESANLTYTINWGPAISPSTISASEWSTKGGVTISAPANTTTTTTAKLTGSSGLYTIINKITTASGAVDSRVIRLLIVDDDQYTAGDYD